MKKLVYVLTLFVFVMTVAACNTEKKSTTTTEETTTTEGTTTTEATCPGGVVTIKYANWNLGTEEENNLERRMIAEFNAQDECRQVVIDENIDPGDWAGSLNAAAAAGTLPDVFMLQTVPDAIANEWVLDISSYVKDDAEWDGLASALTDSITYDNETYAIPFAMFIQGYWINNDLFRQHNAYAPEFGFTWDEFDSAISAMTKPLDGVVGLSEEISVVDYYPALKSENLGWYSFDGSQYNLNSSVFIEGVTKAKSYFDNGYVLDAQSPETKENYFDSPGWWGEAWDSGHIAIAWEASWALPHMINDLTFDWDFIGLPDGKVVLIPDFLGVSAASEHPEVAYEFAKWMSFSKEGYLKRIEIANNNEGIVVNTLPLIDDEDVVDAYFETLDVRGLRAVYNDLDASAIVEGVKVIPGYRDSRWDAPTGIAMGTPGEDGYKDNATINDILWNSFRGNLNYSDHADAINTIANQKYTDANASLGK
ncbi:extracellular solute-binding protein [Mycoplasmatota bacterium]|nr:extracellular solute-binding protein [Mycoplasmatota bacterium]